MMTTWKISFILYAICGLQFGGAINAAVFFSDQFDYADGQLTDTEFMGAPGDNVSGGLWSGHSGTTFDDNVSVISGQAQVLNSGSEDVNRSAGLTMAAGDTWYYGARVTVNFTGAPGDPVNNDYFLHVKDDGFGFRGRVYVDETDGTTFTFGLSASSGGQVAKWGSNLTYGEQYDVLASYDFDTGESKLWVDPVDINSTSISDANGAMTSINALALRQDFISPGIANNEILVDAVAIGDNFDEVLSNLVPEPTSYTLMLLTGLGLFLVGRKRR